MTFLDALNSGKPMRMSERSSGLLVTDFVGVPLHIDPLLDNVYVVQLGGWQTCHVRGSVQAYGALIAYHLAAAYRPEGLT